ncbi:hypothetical protein B0O80DRAFT_421245 [Mortierella sp. GBAus27b]|nr:hypothetical protein BGX31_002554 [Mortierella sp. GBA43]KAI8363528.1 hypothetical protein B0O80DRAFT_421245 [Mortierella sp. GBAus27b]
MRIPSVLLLTTALLLAATDILHPQQANVADAQVSVPGRFSANYAGAPYDDLTASDFKVLIQDDYDGLVDLGKIQAGPPTLQLPHLDNADLLGEEELSVRQMTSQGQEPDGAYQFGKAIPLESFNTASTMSQGRWIPLSALSRQRSSRGSVKSRHADLVEEDDVLVWQLEIHSKSALSLNLIFSDFHLPRGTELYISGKRHILGAFTAEVSNKADGVFATAPLTGNRLLLEYYTPKSIVQQGQMPRIQLSHVIHGYKQAPLASSSDVTAKGLRQMDGSFVSRSRGTRDFRDQTSANSLATWLDDGDMTPIHAMSGKCNVDVACHLSEYYDQSRSVGVILTDYNQKYCTGALVNNAKQDGRQLFLTANHCSSYSNTMGHIVMFNHEKTRCGSSTEVLNEHDTAMGLVKLGSYAPSDYTLYEIVEEIPDAYNLFLSGWSALPSAPSSRARTPSSNEIVMSPWRTPRSSRIGRFGAKGEVPVESPVEHPPSKDIPVVGIHHPSGDSKKISFFFNGSLAKTCWSECDDEGPNHWKIPRWDEGTTEPGSSGSPLFDADKRIVGQLHGGAASCYNKNGYDAYGAIASSFQTPPKIQDRLSTYLDPESTGVKFLDGYSLTRARRESVDRRRDDSELDLVDLVMRDHLLDRKPVAPLGRPGLEKPGVLPDNHY